MINVSRPKWHRVEGRPICWPNSSCDGSQPIEEHGTLCLVVKVLNRRYVTVDETRIGWVDQQTVHPVAKFKVAMTQYFMLFGQPSSNSTC